MSSVDFAPSQAVRQLLQPTHSAFLFIVPNASPVDPRAQVGIQHAEGQNSIAEVESQPQLEPIEAVITWIAFFHREQLSKQ